MYKIAIADIDEGSVELVKHIVKEKLKGAEVLGVVSSGNDVIQLVKELCPEILIINVNILDLNGMEAVKRIREFDNKIHVIIISPYDSIDFAREAINLKVDDYILKPINSDLLIKSIEMVANLVENEKSNGYGIRKIEEAFRDTNEFLDYSFIYSVLFAGRFEDEMIRYKELLNLDDFGYILNIERIYNVVEKKDSLLDTRLIYNCIKDIVSKSYNCVVGPRILNRIIVYVSVENEKWEDAIQGQQSTTLANKIIRGLKKEFELDVTIGIGGVKTIGLINESYKEALQCLRYKDDCNIVQVEDIMNSRIDKKEYLNIEAKVLESIRFGKEETLNLFSEILDIIKPLTQEAKRNKILELLILSCREVRVNDMEENEYIDYIQYFRNSIALKDEEFEEWAFEKFEYIIKAVRLNRTSKKSNSVSTAIKYIECHYSESISLDGVSKYIGISPQHFSKIFKDETGINYVDWLANLRISMAKKLLNEGEKTIKEICFLVGYNDPNYFSRIFKKIVGISPIKYSREGIPLGEV